MDNDTMKDTEENSAPTETPPAETPAESKKPPRQTAAMYTPGEKITQCRTCGSKDSKVIRVERRQGPNRCIRHRSCRQCIKNGKKTVWITVDLENWKAKAKGDPRPPKPRKRLKPLPKPEPQEEPPEQ